MQAFQNHQHQAIASSQLKQTVLQWGSIGSEVEELQRLLTHWQTYKNSCDGIFDTTVENAVKLFQHRVLLPETGIVNLPTWEALYTGAPVNMPELRRGCKGAAVSTIQYLLRSWGDSSAVDGIFTATTETAVRSFQRHCGLVPDGIVGYHTWHALSKVLH